MATKLCGEHAAFRFTWPGKPESHVCVIHGMQVVGIANAIGLPLQLVPLGYMVEEGPPKEWATCQQHVPVEETHAVGEEK
jgi:hypothetical protein